MKMNSKRLFRLSVGSIHHGLQIYILLQLLPSWTSFSNVHVVQDPTYKLGDYDWCQSHENENRAFPSENGKGLRFTDISLP